MKFQDFNTSLTFKLYTIAGLIFGIYGGRVCPMLETLTLEEVLVHTGVVFSVMFVIRMAITRSLVNKEDVNYIKLDTALFFFMSVPFSLFYRTVYDFPYDSNLKVLFGMTLFGFFTGSILHLSHQINSFNDLLKQNQASFNLMGKRRSLVKQMITLVVLLLCTLAIMMSMVAFKDIHWLENTPEALHDGSGKLSILKEFIYISAVLTGYAITIMLLWAKLMKQILISQERALIQVTNGNIDARLPVAQNDELGAMARMTNQMLDSLQDSQDEVKTTRDVAIVSLAALAESRDNETGAHILRTQEYVKALAIHLSGHPKLKEQLTPSYIDLLYKSAPLHDVGKVGIPDSVLLKPGKLTDEEFEIMKGHPQIGADALSIAEKRMGSSSFLRVAREIALTHHEKWDGTGYPNALSGEGIPLSGRLMALADVYDALITKRVYKPAFSHEKAKGIILEGKGKHFDPEVVDAFLAIEEEFMAIAAQYKDMKQETPKQDPDTGNLQFA
ncbi:HD domain-containing protein [Vibrio sp. SCSIO 43132]|uniref:HD domain-containing phosphohydrolase n=1 Tax=Vibrio sp. SCSIO 43132 TaxID=2779363 RepID=UPI001CAA2F85|nr:HD domain-containing phosphohydrolase [Vibrio sp. SCSIO 43132]UAB69039.1 HD domain-containing protein [Vibrio sp. SCSIO 43132]